MALSLNKNTLRFLLKVLSLKSNDLYGSVLYTI